MCSSDLLDVLVVAFAFLPETCEIALRNAGFEAIGVLLHDHAVAADHQRALREQRALLEADCRAFGELEGARGFRIDHLRVRHNIKVLREQRSKEKAA